MANLKDLIGQKFGRLTVIERAENSKSNRSRWKCKCECGNTTIVLSESLLQGATKSCGCIKKTHGLSNTRLHNIWGGMNYRCYNHNSKDFVKYGGRGISVCEKWKNSFQAFYNWAMANGYNDELSIDRIDANGNYCPENCRWTTAKEQNNNRGYNVLITYRGQSKTISQWAEEYGINRNTLQSRLYKCHWSIEKALTTPSKTNEHY